MIHQFYFILFLSFFFLIYLSFVRSSQLAARIISARVFPTPLLNPIVHYWKSVSYAYLQVKSVTVTALASNGIEYMLPIISTDNTVSGLNFGQIFYNLQYNIIEQKILPFK